MVKVAVLDERVIVQCPYCERYRSVSPVSIIKSPERYQNKQGICAKCSNRLRLEGRGALIRQGQAQVKAHAQRIRPAEEATNALPGSAEKIRVLAYRYETNQELYHPDDAGVIAITRKELLWIHEVALVSIEEQARLRGLSPLLVEVPISNDEDD